VRRSTACLWRRCPSTTATGRRWQLMWALKPSSRYSAAFMEFSHVALSFSAGIRTAIGCIVSLHGCHLFLCVISVLPLSSDSRRKLCCMQIRSHAQKWFIQMQKKGKGDMIPPKTGDVRGQGGTMRDGGNDTCTQSHRPPQRINSSLVRVLYCCAFQSITPQSGM
jgi:hypothetical protein